MMTNRKLLSMHFDDDILANARAYVDKQIATMNAFGLGAVDLTDEQKNLIVLRVAWPAQEVRNWNARTEQRRAALLN